MERAQLNELALGPKGGRGPNATAIASPQLINPSLQKGLEASYERRRRRLAGTISPSRANPMIASHGHGSALITSAQTPTAPLKPSQKRADQSISIMAAR